MSEEELGFRAGLHRTEIGLLARRTDTADRHHDQAGRRHWREAQRPALGDRLGKRDGHAGKVRPSDSDQAEV